MRGYLGLAATGRDISVDVLNRVRTVIETAFPVPPDIIRGRERHGRGVSLFAWTNEPDDSRQPPMLSGHGDRIIGLNGHLADPADAARLPDDSVGGCFSAWSARDGELTASTGGGWSRRTSPGPALTDRPLSGQAAAGPAGDHGFQAGSRPMSPRNLSSAGASPGTATSSPNAPCSRPFGAICAANGSSARIVGSSTP